MRTTVHREESGRPEGPGVRPGLGEPSPRWAVRRGQWHISTGPPGGAALMLRVRASLRVAVGMAVAAGRAERDLTPTMLRMVPGEEAHNTVRAFNPGR